jgi:hypothetical protein
VLQVLQLLQESQLSQHLLRCIRALRRSSKLGLQHESQHESQQEPHEPPPPQQELAAGAAAGAAAAGAGSAPAKHAVVRSKNAAFTRVILRWSHTSAEGRRISTKAIFVEPLGNPRLPLRFHTSESHLPPETAPR